MEEISDILKKALESGLSNLSRDQQMILGLTFNEIIGISAKSLEGYFESEEFKQKYPKAPESPTEMVACIYGIADYAVGSFKTEYDQRKEFDVLKENATILRDELAKIIKDAYIGGLFEFFNQIGTEN